MGSLSRTVRQLTCWSSSASSLPPWPPPSSIPTMGTTGCTATPATATPWSRAPWSTTQLPIILLPPIITNGYPMAAPVAGTRNLIKFGNFLELNGEFEQVATATTTVPMTVVKGNFNIQQNGILDTFSSNDAKFSMYVMSSTDLTGKNIKTNLATGADCVAAIAAGLTELTMVNAPPSINGFYISGTTPGYNLDGMNSKTSLMGATKWLVLTESGTTIGCSKAALQ